MSKQNPKGGIKNGSSLVLREKQKSRKWHGECKRDGDMEERSPVASASDASSATGKFQFMSFELKTVQNPLSLK